MRHETDEVIFIFWRDIIGAGAFLPHLLKGYFLPALALNYDAITPIRQSMKIYGAEALIWTPIIWSNNKLQLLIPGHLFCS